MHCAVSDSAFYPALVVIFSNHIYGQTYHHEDYKYYLTIVAYGSAETEGFNTVPAEEPHLTKLLEGGICCI